MTLFFLSFPPPLDGIVAPKDELFLPPVFGAAGFGFGRVPGPLDQLLYLAPRPELTGSSCTGTKC